MKLNVSTIAMLLTKPEYLFSGANIEAMQLGRMIHDKVYSRRQRVRLCKTVDGVEIVGYPDSVQDGVVEELKAISGNSRQDQMEYARIQANIYCYLAGLHKYRVRLFNVTILQEESIEYNANYEKAMQDITKAIDIQRKMYQVLAIS